ncbi:MAG: VCBS repeat-containing protein [Verrucomicrobiota bacterium]
MKTPALLIVGMVISLATPGFAEWKKHVIQRPVMNFINSAVANDWNRDGAIDVISSLEGRVILFKGPDWKPVSIHQFAEGQSRNKMRPFCIHSCLMDVDGDGDLDFIGSNNTVFWLECPDDPLSGEPWTFRLVDDEILGTHCLITGDVNQDGKLDLIANSGRSEPATTLPHSIAWLEVPEDPHSADAWIRHIFADQDAPGGSHYTGFGDVNGDGRPDISCAAKGGEKIPGGEWFAWWEQPEDPTLVWKKHLLAVNQPGASNVIPADLNGDGAVDYFATRGHGKGALWFKGPYFELIEIDPSLAYPHSLDLADIDEDGDIDAVTCGKEADGTAVWYENDGEGNFTRRLIGKDQGSYDTRAIDMDGDGDLDVLIAGHASSNIVWFENPLK